MEHTKHIWRAVILVILLFRIIDCMKVFAIIFGTTGGGPLTTTESVQVLAYRIAFKEQAMSLSMATMVVFAVVVLVLAVGLGMVFGSQAEGVPGTLIFFGIVGLFVWRRHRNRRIRLAGNAQNQVFLDLCTPTNVDDGDPAGHPGAEQTCEVTDWTGYNFLSRSGKHRGEYREPARPPSDVYQE